MRERSGSGGKDGGKGTGFGVMFEFVCGGGRHERAFHGVQIRVRAMGRRAWRSWWRQNLPQKIANGVELMDEAIEITDCCGV